MGPSDYRVKPNGKFKIKDCDSDDTGTFKRREDAEADAEQNLKQMRELQEVLYAQSQKSLLVVLQAMDAGGKDGTIDHIFSGVNPQGCSVHSFKAPSLLERSHDFLWRHHQAAPARGMIAIHNRSHYEAVLVERVHDLAPKAVWKKRFDHINNFEKLLADEGTTIVKFFLHISYEEQAKRLQARLDDPQKNWKFDPNDLEERKHWDAYMEAFEDAIGRCSTEEAPWYVVPSDHKWFRNWVIGNVLVKSLKNMDLNYPEPIANIAKYKVI